MNAARYKLMLSYLPGMAAIVNSFQSPEVQRSVYESLMDALNVRMDAESPGAGTPATNGRQRVSSSTTRPPAVTSSAPPDSDVISTVGDLAHELEEGDSIHSLMEQHASLP